MGCVGRPASACPARCGVYKRRLMTNTNCGREQTSTEVSAVLCRQFVSQLPFLLFKFEATYRLVLLTVMIWLLSATDSAWISISTIQVQTS